MIATSSCLFGKESNMIITLVPLLGPIGGGLGLGASPSAGGAAVAGGAAPSSAALTTSFDVLLALFFEEKYTMLVLEAEPVWVETLGANANPEAADAMLQLAMFCVTVNKV